MTIHSETVEYKAQSRLGSNGAALRELKHSVQLHLLIHQGANPQLSVYGVKFVDFFDAFYEILAMNDVRQAREALQALELEIQQIAFNMVEALAIFVQRSIDDRKSKADAQKIDFPERIRQKSDELLILIGKSRGLPDKIAAKNAVLTGIADALRALSVFTKAKYPDIHDSAGNVL